MPCSLTIMLGLSDSEGIPIVTGRPIDDSKVRKLLMRIGRVAGGFTLTETHGGWTDDKGQLMTEQSVKIETVVSDSSDQWSAVSDILGSVWSFLNMTSQDCAIIHTPEGGWVTLSISDRGIDGIARQLVRPPSERR